MNLLTKYFGVSIIIKKEEALREFYKIFLLLIVLCLIGYAQQDQRPDSNFKSIHQLESETHQKNISKNDTILEKETSDSEAQENQMRSIINFSLIVIIMLILIIALSLILILRRIHRGREREMGHPEK